MPVAFKNSQTNDASDSEGDAAAVGDSDSSGTNNVGDTVIAISDEGIPETYTTNDGIPEITSLTVGD